MTHVNLNILKRFSMLKKENEKKKIKLARFVVKKNIQENSIPSLIVIMAVGNNVERYQFLFLKYILYDK